jgi:hypothetical protein
MEEGRGKGEVRRCLLIESSESTQTIIMGKQATRLRPNFAWTSPFELVTVPSSTKYINAVHWSDEDIMKLGVEHDCTSIHHSMPSHRAMDHQLKCALLELSTTPPVLGSRPHGLLEAPMPSPLNIEG